MKNGGGKLLHYFELRNKEKSDGSKDKTVEPRIEMGKQKEENGEKWENGKIEKLEKWGKIDGQMGNCRVTSGKKGKTKEEKWENKRGKLVNEERTVGHVWKLREENVTQRGQRMKQPDREKNCEVSGENLKGRPGV